MWSLHVFVSVLNLYNGQRTSCAFPQQRLLEAALKAVLHCRARLRAVHLDRHPKQTDAMPKSRNRAIQPASSTRSRAKQFFQTRGRPASTRQGDFGIASRPSRSVVRSCCDPSVARLLSSLRAQRLHVRPTPLPKAVSLAPSSPSFFRSLLPTKMTAAIHPNGNARAGAILPEGQ